jgi:Rod binding domain-containing protein
VESANLILTEPVGPPSPLGQLGTSSLESIPQDQREKVAKDFESILLNKLFDEMQSTIGDWGFEKDGPFKQVQGIFYLFLARDTANKGGVGLWKDIYEFLSKTDAASAPDQSLEADI